MKKIINSILILVVIVAFGKVAYKGYQYYMDKKEYSRIQIYNPMIIENIPNNGVKNEDNYEEKSSNNEEVLVNINNDYKFWLNISNSNIDYPVVQGIDNDFYLNHSFDKEKSISGTLFIDYQNNIDSDKNIVIYGHHMKNNTMFNNLNFFKKEEFFNNNNIKIVKDGKTYEYTVFSVYVLHENEVSIDMNFNNDTDYLSYINELSNKSYFKKDIEFEPSKKIITLVTCSYEYDGARTIVHAIKK
ncbi:class B sortase [Clostridium nigeriense]|uniref:class B sortase n=1 Tax=Clostridium nigeriense TaxID=1805470 RepID=UPI003D345895